MQTTDLRTYGLCSLKLTLAMTLLPGVGCAAGMDDAQQGGADVAMAEAHNECPPGDGQSPIDLPDDLASSTVESLIFDYRESQVAIANTGATVQYNYDAGSGVWLGDVRFQLVQFHFHAHSEHAIAGQLQPMELHLVHKSASDRVLVIGILIADGAHNETLDLADWEDLPKEDVGSVAFPKDVFNAFDFVPGGPTYRYLGSLTAPPCSGDVSWIVYRQPIAMDAAQLAVFTRLYPDNFREVQPVGDRTVSFGE
jgi:carbonic anhydrase